MIQKAGTPVVLILALALSLAECADDLFPWMIAHAPPGMERLNKRMNDRAYERQFAGDPLKELEWYTTRGNYRFRGLKDLDIGATRTWVPGVKGVPDDPVLHLQYECLFYDHTTAWADAAIRYYTIYNRALLVKRRGKKLDECGLEAKQ